MTHEELFRRWIAEMDRPGYFERLRKQVERDHEALGDRMERDRKTSQSTVQNKKRSDVKNF